MAEPLLRYAFPNVPALESARVTMLVLLQALSHIYQQEILDEALVSALAVPSEWVDTKRLAKIVTLKEINNRKSYKWLYFLINS